MPTTRSKSAKRRLKRQHRHRSYVHLPFAYRVRRKTFFRFLGGSSVCILLLCLIPYGIYQFTADSNVHDVTIEEAIDLSVEEVSRVEEMSQKSKPAPVPVKEPQTQPPEVAKVIELPEVISLKSILEKYRTATGLREVQSLLLHGSYLEDGRTFDMKLAAKAPDLVRKTLSDNALSVVCSYNGQETKIEIQSGPDGQTVTQPLEDKIYQKAIELEGAFLSLADFDAELQAPLFDWQADQVYNGKPCWTVVSKLPGSTQISHLIDQETSFEQARYLDLVVAGTKYQLSIHFSDFRQDKALHLPHAYTLKVNGMIRGEARIESIQRNSGLMPWMF